jgi:hypothetical protein
MCCGGLERASFTVYKYLFDVHFEERKLVCRVTGWLVFNHFVKHGGGNPKISFEPGRLWHFFDSG